MSNKLVRYFFSKAVESNKQGNIYLEVRNSVFKNLDQCSCLAEAFNKCKMELL